MHRALSAASLSPQERQRLIQQALSMDAPKLARQLISEAYSDNNNEDNNNNNIDNNGGVNKQKKKKTTNSGKSSKMTAEKWVF